MIYIINPNIKIKFFTFYHRSYTSKKHNWNKLRMKHDKMLFLNTYIWFLLTLEYSTLASLHKIWISLLLSFYYFLLGKCIQVVFKDVLFMKLLVSVHLLDSTCFSSQAKSYLLSPCFIIFSSMIPGRDHKLIILFFPIWFMKFLLGCQCTWCHPRIIDCDSFFFGRTLVVSDCQHYLRHFSWNACQQNTWPLCDLRTLFFSYITSDSS